MSALGAIAVSLYGKYLRALLLKCIKSPKVFWADQIQSVAPRFPC